MIACMIFGVSGVGKSSICRDVKTKLNTIGKRCKVIEYRDVLNYINEHINISEDILPHIPELIGEKKFREIYYSFLKYSVSSFSIDRDIDVLLIPVQASGLVNNEWRFVFNENLINFCRKTDNLHLVFIDSSTKEILEFRNKKISEWHKSIPSDNYLNPYIVELERILELNVVAHVSIFTSKSVLYIRNSIKNGLDKSSEKLLNFIITLLNRDDLNE